MYLKVLTIHGFKSFAHPVQVPLSPGLNVVVGPNGSGKSNLIDALRWALGERRGGRQVLFHGSKTHRPIGMASVALLFEPALQVEKRAFASGEVEYFFQGKKVRFGDLRQELAKAGLSLHQLGVSFVTNRDLHALVDLTPLERLRWLEEISGTLAMRTHLAGLAHTLQGVVEKRERFRERLREVAFQRARVAEWARKEEEYLQREKRLRIARRAYYGKLLEKLRRDYTRLVEEESLCHQELRRLLDEQSLFALRADETNLRELRNTLSSLRHEVEEVQKKVVEKERELYQLLTEMRHGRRLRFILDVKGKDLLEEIDRLLRERERFQMPLEASARLENAERVVLRFLTERKVRLQALEEEKRKLQEEAVRFETMLNNVERELESLRARYGELTREIEELKRRCAGVVREREHHKREAEALEQERENLQRRLLRTREVLACVRRVREEVEFQKLSGTISEEIHRALSEKGWPNRAIHAFLGFISHVQVLEGGAVPEDFGKWMIFRTALPPSSSEWAVARKEMLLANLQKEGDLQQNYVALDGSLVVLKGGLFLFPRKVALKARFGESWRRRESHLVHRIQELEKVMRETTRAIEEVKRRQRELELCAVRWQERLRQKEEMRQEIERRIMFLSVECDSLREHLREITAGIQSVLQKGEVLQGVISRAEKALKKIAEKREQQEAEKRRYEKFLWDAQNVDKEARSIVASARENTRNLWFLEEQLVRCGWELSKLLIDRTAKEAALRAKEEEEQRLEKSIEVKRQEEKNLERRREKWLRERERLRFAKEKLCADIGRVEDVLAHLKSEDEGYHEFQTMNLRDLQEFIESEERVLANIPVRRGAIEEYEELRSREESLVRQDMCFEELITLAFLEWRGLERDIRRQFLSFLDTAKEAFSQYFQRIFRGGQVTLSVRDDGAYLEVEIPGKKRQSISLLSSGERTLVALCFLCACLEAGGAKMCFFDEIDTHLDHTNSALLAQVLKEFAAKRQVVVVTHKEEIMEVADCILGVTMNEPGVSQVLSCGCF
ncbi:MAG: chromosome segregation protein SMC [Candidatus Caldatribacterium sp.]|nr:chromosome segregation protein SMC [Candidatus Caldatribacterium sp.]